MTVPVESQVLLATLARFEEQIGSCKDRNAIVELFCIQIIPFLQTQALLVPLKDQWRKKYQKLLYQIEISEKDALNEVKEIYSHLADIFKNGKKPITEKLDHIRMILSEDPRAGFSTWPLYKVVYYELKELLQMILEDGERRSCQQYANLKKTKKTIIHPNSHLEFIEEFIITNYTFAPSVEKAARALKATHWDQLRDAAVVWQYFEIALWCWNTSESYFEKTDELLKKHDKNPLPALSEKSVWFEIAIVKNGSQDHNPAVFTNQFFKEGMQTLVNEIMAFASKGFQLEKEPDDSLNRMVFELQLEENRLWVFVRTGLAEPKKYYLKRFNDGAMEGSGPYEFIQYLLQKHPEGGDVEIDILDKSDSIQT